MTYTLQVLASHVQGYCDPTHAQIKIQGVGSLEQAKAMQLCFLDHKRHVSLLAQTKAAAVLITADLSKNSAIPTIIVDAPKRAFIEIIHLMYPEKTDKSGIHKTVIIGKNTQIHETAIIGPYCVIGDHVRIQAGVRLQSGVIMGDGCMIDQDSVLEANVVLYANVTIGRKTRIGSGSVLGSDGFGFIPNPDQSWLKIPHVGGVRIGSTVDIGSNTTIDRGMLDDTIVADGVVVDNLVHIAHNVQIGAHTAIAAGAMIAGSTKIGRYCQIGGGSLINGHISLADHTALIGGAQVVKTLKTGVYASAMPAKPYATWVKNTARFHHLDEIARRLKSVEQKIHTEDGE